MPCKADDLLGTISGLFITLNKSLSCFVFMDGIPEAMELVILSRSQEGPLVADSLMRKKDLVPRKGILSSEQ